MLYDKKNFLTYILLKIIKDRIYIKNNAKNESFFNYYYKSATLNKSDDNIKCNHKTIVINQCTAKMIRRNNFKLFNIQVPRDKQKDEILVTFPLNNIIKYINDVNSSIALETLRVTTIREKSHKTRIRLIIEGSVVGKCGRFFEIKIRDEMNILATENVFLMNCDFQINLVVENIKNELKWFITLNDGILPIDIDIGSSLNGNEKEFKGVSGVGFVVSQSLLKPILILSFVIIFSIFVFFNCLLFL